MAAMATPRFPNEDWDEEPRNNTREEPPMQAASSEVPIQAEPGPGLEGQVRILKNPLVKTQILTSRRLQRFQPWMSHPS